MVVALIVSVSSCKKKDDPRSAVYRTWIIKEMQGTGMDEIAKAELMKSENSVEFTRRGKMIMRMGGEETEGSFEVNETATTITTRANGMTEDYTISNLSESSMTLSDGEMTMNLSAKK